MIVHGPDELAPKDLENFLLMRFPHVAPVLIWVRKGRNRVRLLARGDLEIPSDRAGAEVRRFTTAPTESSEPIRAFIDMIDAS
jgi:hypothetical protein